MRVCVQESIGQLTIWLTAKRVGITYCAANSVSDCSAVLLKYDSLIAQTVYSSIHVFPLLVAVRSELMSCQLLVLYALPL